MMLTAGGSGALFDLYGDVSNNATWDEYIYFSEAGSAVDLTGLEFELQFRQSSEDASTYLTLSTADSELVLTQDDASVLSIVRINVPYSTISGLVGDYVTDLVAKDSNDKLTHYAHGVVTFHQAPVAF